MFRRAALILQNVCKGFVFFRCLEEPRLPLKTIFQIEQLLPALNEPGLRFCVPRGVRSLAFEFSQSKRSWYAWVASSQLSNYK